MATNWSAYEAAKEIYGNNKENIAEIGSRFPLLTRTVSMANSDYVLDILKALPKVTARVLETGLKGVEIDSDVTEETEETKKPAKKAKKEESEGEGGSYDTMTSKELYALCCERGISSLCKSRKKESLIELLEKYDAGEIEKTNGSRKKAEKAESKKVAKPSKKSEPEDDWDEEDDWDDEEETNPYEGKTAKELFKMCTDRGIKTKPKQSADAYVKLLQKADEAEADTESEDDEDEGWEI